MGVTNTSPQQTFNPPTPSVQFNNKEISWQQLAPVISEQTRKMFEVQKNIHKGKLVHWYGSVAAVFSNNVSIKMNPSIQNQIDVKLLFDKEIDPAIFSPLLNTVVDFIGEIIEVDLTLTLKFKNYDIYSQRNLNQKQRQIVDILVKSSLTSSSLIQKLQQSPSWLEFLIDSAPNTYQHYLKALQKNLVVFNLTNMKNVLWCDQQQFQIVNSTQKFKNLVEVFGQIKENVDGVMKIVSMQLKEVKKFDLQIENKICLLEEEREKLIFYQQQAQNQKKSLMALLKKSIAEQEVQLFQVEKMTTQNKILNNLVNKEAVLTNENDEKLFV